MKKYCICYGAVGSSQRASPLAGYSRCRLVNGRGAAGLAWTNNEGFCISCHEMRNNVYAEYKGTIHDTNHTGVRTASRKAPGSQELKFGTRAPLASVAASGEHR